MRLQPGWGRTFGSLGCSGERKVGEAVVLRVGVLGPVTAWYGDQELPVGQPRQQAVLGILAMRANRVISRGELVDAVWGQDPPASAEGGIYTYVAGLRRVIEPNRSLRGPGRVLVSSGAGYVLHLVPGQPDAVAFEQDLGRARQLRKTGDLASAVVALNSALSLWRGIAFAGVPGPFAETERVRLGELRSAAAEERADVLLSLGRHEEAVPDLTAMVADHPLRERMRGLLMVALYRCGRHAEALRVFAEGRRVLAEELGIDPGGDLSRIHQQVLTMDPALSVPNGLAIRGASGSPPSDEDADSGPAPDGGQRRPRPEGRATPVPAQLPLDAPGFSGRREELTTLHAMLQESGQQDSGQTVPIVVISGTAGTGKTALAIRFGHQVAKQFPSGQLYVNLRGLDPATPPLEPAEALRFFLDALGVPPHRIPADTEGRSALFRSMLDDRQMLIVLDNARNVGQVRPLLPGAPGSLVVVTSRNELTGLVAAEGAVPLTLDVLGDREAHEMLARRLSPARVAAEPAAADEIIAACARRRAARRAGPAGRARGRRRGDQRAGRALLVLRPALRARGADVPPARRAPRPGHIAVGRGEPGRDAEGRGGCRAARTGPEPHGGRVPAGPVYLPRPAPRVRHRSSRTDRPRTRAQGRVAPGAGPLSAHRDGGLQPVQPAPVRAPDGQPAAGRPARRGDGQGPGHGLVRRRGPGAAHADRLRRHPRLRHPRLADPVDARPVLQPARPVAGLHREPADRAGRG